MEYKTTTGLRVYKMDKSTGNVTKTDYVSLRYDGIIDVRTSAYSAQYGPSSLTLNDLSSGKATRYGVGQFLTKVNSSSSWATLTLPQKAGTLATIVDITDAINSFSSNTLPSLLSNAIKSKSEWLRGTSDRTLSIDLSTQKGYIILYRSNDSSQDIQLTYTNPENGTQTAASQMMIVFIPKETYASNRKRIWVITIDQGTFMPSVDASTYDALTSSLTFAPTASAAVDRLVMEY